MDPLSLVGTILGIVSVVAKATLSLSDLQSRYKIADLKVTLLIGQLSTLKAALTQVRHLIENVSLGAQLVDDLSTSLSSLGTIISALSNQLDQLQLNAGNGLSKWAKVSFVWDEQTMRDYLSLLDHQVNALQLLLSALQCRTIFEQCDMLSTRESRHILQRARDETSSMRWLTDTESTSIAGTLRSIETQDLETLDARFDFDSEVFTSKAYMAASRTNMIDALQWSRRDGISHSTEITGGPQGDTSDPRGSRQPPRTGIALTTVLEVNRDSGRGSEFPPGIPPGTITAPQASQSAVVRAPDPEAQLPEFVIHTSETLGLLALQFGNSTYPLSNALPSPLGRLLPTTEKETHRGLFKQSRRRPLRIRPEQQAATRWTINKVRGYKPVKILLLGISESGKSTLAKTMRAAHGDIDVHWLREYRFTVVNNTILSLKWLLSKLNDVHSEIQSLQQNSEGSWDAEAFPSIARIVEELEYDVCPETSSLATLASAAQYFWNHPYIREVFKTSIAAQLPGHHSLYLPDCAEYFLNSIQRIFKEDYLPSLEDVLWAQTRTTGTSESKFVINSRTYQLFDVGGSRSERKKWVHVFEKQVDMLVFTIDCSCYVKVTNEDNTTNRMDEQFLLWQGISNTQWFKDAKIVVLFTKEDKLTPETLRRHPFDAKYTDYNGDPESAGDVVKYITWRLDSMLDQGQNIRSGHVTVCRSGSISESLKVWVDLLSIQGNSF